MTTVHSTSNQKNLWIEHSGKCQRDLIVKKIACAIIVGANLAALGALLYYVVLYCPISTEVMVIAPIVGGVLGAMTYLKIPIKLIDDNNYESYSTPAFVTARFLTFLCFAPIVIAIRNMDWTNYADPYVAHRIAGEIKNSDKTNFEEVLLKQGSRVHNLKRYGFISKDKAIELKTLYRDAKPFLLAKQFLIKEKAPQKNIIEIETKLCQFSERWDTFKSSAAPSLPDLTPAIPQFSSTLTKIKLWIREHFGIYLLNNRGIHAINPV